jgi:hypothetical protein
MSTQTPAVSATVAFRTSLALAELTSVSGRARRTTMALPRTPSRTSELEVFLMSQMRQT